MVLFFVNKEKCITKMVENTHKEKKKKKRSMPIDQQQSSLINNEIFLRFFVNFITMAWNSIKNYSSNFVHKNIHPSITNFAACHICSASKRNDKLSASGTHQTYQHSNITSLWHPQPPFQLPTFKSNYGINNYQQFFTIQNPRLKSYPLSDDTGMAWKNKITNPLLS